MDIKSRKYVRFIIAKGQNAPRITAGKLFPLNFRAFLKVSLRLSLIASVVTLRFFPIKS